MVLWRLHENRLSINAEKCEIHSDSVQIWEFIVRKGQLRANQAKARGVVKWLTPNTEKQLQRFLGFANLHRTLIRNYSLKISDQVNLE